MRASLEKKKQLAVLTCYQCEQTCQLHSASAELSHFSKTGVYSVSFPVYYTTINFVLFSPAETNSTSRLLYTSEKNITARIT